MTNYERLEQIADLMNDLRNDIYEVENKYNNEIDELDIDSISFAYNRANIEDEKSEEIGEILAQVPDITFVINYGDDEVETVTAMDILENDVELFGIENVDIV